MPENDGGAQQGNAGGSGTVEYPGWMASLPDAHKTNERFAQFKEAPLVWDKFDSLLQAEGKAIVIPDEKATDADRAAFYGKLGRPETADKYVLKRPTLPEGMQYDEAGEKWFREQAHKFGLNQGQAAQLFEAYNGRMDGIIKDIEAKRTKAAQEGVETLKKEWGGELEANLELVKRATTAFLTPEDKKFMDESGLGNHHVLVKMFQRMGKALAEDKFVAGRITKTTPTGAFVYPSMKE